MMASVNINDNSYIAGRQIGRVDQQVKKGKVIFSVIIIIIMVLENRILFLTYLIDSVLPVNIRQSLSKKVVFWSDTSSNRVMFNQEPFFRNFHLSTSYLWVPTFPSFDSYDVSPWFMILSKDRVSSRTPSLLTLSVPHGVPVNPVPVNLRIDVLWSTRGACKLDRPS